MAWEDPFSPNAYVGKDPKELLLKLEDNANKTGMQCKYKKNTHKIEFKFPLADGNTLINFEVHFEKGRKKKDMGLYRVRFYIPEDDHKKLQENDIEFLTTGFLRLIDQFAEQVDNHLYCIEDTS